MTLSSPNKTVTFFPRSSSKLDHTSSGTVALTSVFLELMYVSSLVLFEKLFTKSFQPSASSATVKEICLFSKDLSVEGTSLTIKSSASFKKVFSFSSS